MLREQLIDRHRALWRRLTDWASLALLILMIAVPIILFIWFVFFTETFVVQAVTVVDAREHTRLQVEETVNQLIGKNMFFVQTDLMEDQVLGQLPQIRTLHIARKLPSTLKVVVQEKTPRLLLLSKGKYYFVDEAGIAYEEARLETLPGVVLPTIKNSDQEAQLTLGVAVLDPSFLQFIEEVQKELPGLAASPPPAGAEGEEATSAAIAEIRIPSLAAREVHVILSNNWEIKFDITRPARGQLQVLEKLLAETLSESERATLTRIDLRIRNRVYYQTGTRPSAPLP